MMRRLLVALLVTVVAAGGAFGSIYSTTIAADAPVHWYRLGETSGTVANDAGSSVVAGDYAGTLNTGYFLSEVGITGALPNTAARFNGTTGDVSTNLATVAAVGIPSSANGVGWSFEGWAKTSANATTQSIAGNNGTKSGWVTGFHSTNKFFFNMDNDSGTCGGSTYGTTGNVGSWSTGNYYHVVATSIGAGSAQLTNMKLYVNGSLLSTVTSFTGSICTTGMHVVLLAARDGTTPGLFMTGTLDEAAFYQAQLSQTQVTTHYNAGISVSGSFAWPFQTRRPELPGFINKDYLAQAVARGYNTGLLTSREIHPQLLNVGYANFAQMPWGNVGH
jgi:hypothetical protein